MAIYTTDARNQEVGFWYNRGTYDNPPSQDQPTTHEDIGIDSGPNAVTTIAPAASKEDSHSRAFLKFHLAWISGPDTDF